MNLMSSFFNSGPLPDWKELRKWLGKDMPWDKLAEWDQEGSTNADWLNQYMKEILSKTKPTAKVRSQADVRMEAAKDAKYVNVTIRFAPDTNIRQLQLFATSDRLRVTGLSDIQRRFIRFPCLVYPRSGKAELTEGQLHVRFKRRPPAKTEYELFIRN
jgi:HSP20 family molecular chaperone IbpA